MCMHECNRLLPKIWRFCLNTPSQKTTLLHIFRYKPFLCRLGIIRQL